MGSSAKGLRCASPQVTAGSRGLLSLSRGWAHEGSESGPAKHTQLTRPEPSCNPEALTSQTAFPLSCGLDVCPFLEEGPHDVPATGLSSPLGQFKTIAKDLIAENIATGCV